MYQDVVHILLFTATCVALYEDETMKEAVEWLLTIEVIIIFVWMLSQSFYWLFGKLLIRDYEQDAIDKVFKRHKMKPGQTIVVTYKDGVVVTMTRPEGY